MPDSDSTDAAPQGFDASKELEKSGPQLPRRSDEITMDVPTTPDLKSHESADDRASRVLNNTVDRSSYVPARILWPALGFPAVIAPNGPNLGIAADPPAARQICLLIICDRDPNRRPLSKLDVAKHLRIVPWAEQHRRWLPTREKGGTNAFKEEDISVAPAKLIHDGSIDESAFWKKVRKVANTLGFGAPALTELWMFAGEPDPSLAGLDISDAENGVRVAIAKYVLKFYRGHGLKYLYDVRVSKEASAAVGQGQHHLFWINPDSTHDETHRSAEMHLLLEEYAKPTWAAQPRNPKVEWLRGEQQKHWAGLYEAILNEYEFGLRQKPNAATRVEVLHPVFIQEAKPKLRIGHLTDLHFDTRWDAYEANLRRSGRPGASKFYNWNRASEKNYRAAKARCDLLLLTGDLVEFGRGYNEIGAMGTKDSYWRDRNWFYVYEAIAAGTKYQKPAYTNLGNHDWRINPYPPFAPGSPALEELGDIDRDDLIAAHGEGHGANTDDKGGKDGADKDYDPLGGKIFKGLLLKKLVRSGSLALKDTPLETTVDSVAWYLLLINPFLDYTCPLPGGYSLTMLDWADRERVDQYVIAGGIDFGQTLLLPNTYGGPVALDAITPHQWWLVQQVADFPVSNPKILGIHAPLLGPWPHWPNDTLPSGRVKFTREDAYAPFRQKRHDETDSEYAERVKYGRGATVDIRDGQRVYEHALKAFRLSKNDPEGQEADYNSVWRNRGELVKLLRKSKFHLVFSGHIHRGNLLIVDIEEMIDVPGKSQKEISPYHGEWLIKSVDEKAALTATGPLYVNTTSCGPPGNNYASRGGVHKRAPSGYAEVVLKSDGTLEQIELRKVTDGFATPAQTVPTPVFK
ncbi:MAG: metallophosphoesterase [Phycisphaerae bacterium]